MSIIPPIFTSGYQETIQLMKQICWIVKLDSVISLNGKLRTTVLFTVLLCEYTC
jgi:hypothetical protein